MNNTFLGKVLGRSGLFFSINSYGAVGDGIEATGTISSLNTLTSSTAVFSSSDVGKVIYINNAGSGGAMHKTTISGFTSSTVVTLAANAAANVSSQKFYFGTNNTTAVQNAINAANNLGGGVVTGAPGKYIISSIELKKHVQFIGSGINSFHIWSANTINEVIGSFSTVNTATEARVKLENMTIMGLDPRNKAAAYADICGTYVDVKNIRCAGTFYGIVFDQTEIATIEKCTIETLNAAFYGFLVGTTSAVNAGWLTQGGTHGNSDYYVTINTLGSDGTAYIYRNLSSTMYDTGFTVRMNPPVVISSDGGSLPNNSILLRVDNGTNRFDIQFTSTQIRLNGGTLRTYSSGAASVIKLDIAPGGATANLWIDGIKVDTNVAALSSLSSAGIYLGDLAVSEDSSTAWRYLEFYSSNPIPAGIWLTNGDHYWNSRNPATYSDGTMALSSAVLNVSYSRFIASDVGKSITVNGAGASGANLVTTIQTFNSSTSVTLAAAASTAVTNTNFTFNASSFVEFTNRIVVKECQLNTTAIQIADDGGYCHSFLDNNYNGGFIQQRFASINIASLVGAEMEGSICSPITLFSCPLQGSSISGRASGIRIKDTLISASAHSSVPFIQVLHSDSLLLDNVFFARSSGACIYSDNTGGVAQISDLGVYSTGASIYYDNINGTNYPAIKNISSNSTTNHSSQIYRVSTKTISLVPVTPAQITSDTNNYNPTSGIISGDNLITSCLRLSTDASRTITGIIAGLSGQYLIIYNVGANPIVLAHENTGSTAANRFLCNTGSNITLNSNQKAELYYDSVSQRWRVN